MSDSPLIVKIGSSSADKVVIWLHGLGADGHDFEPIVNELPIDPSLNIRFVFPHAPMIPVTINQGFVMRAWYDIKAADIGSQPDEQGIRDSAILLNEIIEQQLDLGIKSENILLVGFSQGGVIALHAGLRFKQKLAGIMALSTYMPLADSLDGEKSAANAGLDVFLAHGSADPVISIDMAYKARGLLEAQQYNVEWHEYKGMQHGVNAQEIDDIGAFLSRLWA